MLIRLSPASSSTRQLTGEKLGFLSHIVCLFEMWPSRQLCAELEGLPQGPDPALVQRREAARQEQVDLSTQQASCSRRRWGPAGGSSCTAQRFLEALPAGPSLQAGYRAEVEDARDALQEAGRQRASAEARLRRLDDVKENRLRVSLFVSGLLERLMLAEI